MTASASSEGAGGLAGAWTAASTFLGDAVHGQEVEHALALGLFTTSMRFFAVAATRMTLSPAITSLGAAVRSSPRSRMYWKAARTRSSFLPGVEEGLDHLQLRPGSGTS